VLSIGVMARGQGHYYSNLASESYFLTGGEPPGQWLGHGAGQLGLMGTVEPDTFSGVLAGVSPTGRSLVQNAGDASRRPGWDLTFSAPKSVSVLWSQSEAASRRDIEQAHRQAVEAGISYMERHAAFTRRGLVLRADLLVPWARWITPEGESRRFDARFFAAALPDGQEAVGHEAEADHVAWLRPADAIDSAKAGKISLLPPTATTLNDFASAVAAGAGLTDILAARRAIEPVQPRLVLEDGAAWLVIPDGVEYPL